LLKFGTPIHYKMTKTQKKKISGHLVF